MDNLRLILIIVGVIVLALIILLHKPPGESRRNHARWRATRREPHLGDAPEPEDSAGDRVDDPGPDMTEVREAENGTLWPEAEDEPSGEGEGRGSVQPHPNPDKFVIIYVCRRDNGLINGSELLDAAIRAGLELSDLNIFHRLHEGSTRPVFSMADLSSPGHFDPSAWNVFETRGVTLFLTLPAPTSALDAWDAMLATAERLGELLQADLLDDSQCLLTRQRIAQVREEMREYDRRHGLLGEG